MSYRCSLPSPLQKGSKDWEVLIRLIHKWDHAIYQNLKSWHQFTSAAAYYDTWKIICDILHGYTFSKSLHDFYNAWQSSSCIRFRFFTSSLLQFFDPLCSFLFLVILNLSLNCFQFKRILLSSPPLYWGWQTWAGYWHFVIVRLITLGHDKSILNWCRCNLVVSWVWNRILQRDFKIFIRIRVNGLSKEFVKVHRILCGTREVFRKFLGGLI